MYIHICLTGVEVRRKTFIRIRANRWACCCLYVITFACVTVPVSPGQHYRPGDSGVCFDTDIVGTAFSA